MKKKMAKDKIKKMLRPLLGRTTDSLHAEKQRCTNGIYKEFFRRRDALRDR